MISSGEWLREKAYLDFHDKDSNFWRVGYAVAINQHTVKVRSEGWPSKFDEVLPALFSSSPLTPTVLSHSARWYEVTQAK